VTVFDFVVFGVVVLSALFGFARGFMRVVVSLAAWVFAFLLAVHLSAPLGTMLPDVGGSPNAHYIAAFVLIIIVVLLVGALLGWLLYRLLRAIGLGFLDRLLGAVIGMARGVLIVVIGVLVAGWTSLPQQVWWQNALLAPPLVAAALSLKPWLPHPWAERLDYGKPGRAKPKPAAGTGV
jgi:membrane protein required for colicin V production